jgi:hypothetical protein
LIKSIKGAELIERIFIFQESSKLRTFRPAAAPAVAGPPRLQPQPQPQPQPLGMFGGVTVC